VSAHLEYQNGSINHPHLLRPERRSRAVSENRGGHREYCLCDVRATVELFKIWKERLTEIK